MNSGDPVATLAAPPPVSFGERVARVVERAVERVLYRGHAGILGLSRATRKSRSGDDEGALQLARAVADEPASTPLYVAQARTLEASIVYSRGHDVDAEAVCARVVESDLPFAPHVAFLLLRGTIVRTRGDYAAMLRDADAALAIVDEAHAMQSSRPPQRVPQVFLLRALALKNLGRVDEAIGAVDRAVARAPRFSIVHLIRAGYGVIAGEPDARERLAEVMCDITLLRADGLTWDLNCGWAHAVAGDDDDALAALEAVAEAATVSQRPRLLRYLAVETDFAKLRAHPRFIAVCARLGDVTASTTV